MEAMLQRPHAKPWRPPAVTVSGAVGIPPLWLFSLTVALLLGLVAITLALALSAHLAAGESQTVSAAKTLELTLTNTLRQVERDLLPTLAAVALEESQPPANRTALLEAALRQLPMVTQLHLIEADALVAQAQRSISGGVDVGVLEPAFIVTLAGEAKRLVARIGADELGYLLEPLLAIDGSRFAVVDGLNRVLLGVPLATSQTVRNGHQGIELVQSANGWTVSVASSHYPWMVVADINRDLWWRAYLRDNRVLLATLAALGILLIAVMAGEAWRMQRQQRIHRSRTDGLLRAAETSSQAIVVADDRFRVIYANPTFRAWFGNAPSGATMYLTDSAYRSVVGQAAFADARTLAYGARSQHEVDWRDQRGAQRTLLLDITRASLSEGNSHVLFSWEDVTDLRRQRRELELATEQLQRLANEDELTGLANRRAFVALAERELDRSRRYRHPLSLLLVDLDHFKRINDQFGHAAGDAALVAFAKLAREVLRDIDVAARLGGEEFALLLPETTLDEARAVAERLRARVHDTPVEPGGGNVVRLTASVGVAAWRAPDEPLDGLLRRADDAMYAAKGDGRNRVRLANGGGVVKGLNAGGRPPV